MPLRLLLMPGLWTVTVRSKNTRSGAALSWTYWCTLLMLIYLLTSRWCGTATVYEDSMKWSNRLTISALACLSVCCTLFNLILWLLCNIIIAVSMEKHGSGIWSRVCAEDNPYCKICEVRLQPAKQSQNWRYSIFISHHIWIFIHSFILYLIHPAITYDFEHVNSKHNIS